MISETTVDVGRAMLCAHMLHTGRENWKKDREMKVAEMLINAGFTRFFEIGENEPTVKELAYFCMMSRLKSREW